MTSKSTPADTIWNWNRYETVIHPDGSQSSSKSEVVVDYSLKDTFTGVSLPNWKDVVRAGGNATTPASGVKYHWRNRDAAFYSMQATRPSDGTVWIDTGYGTPNNFGGVVTVSTPDASLITRVNNRAIRQFIDKANSARSSIEAGQDIGELRQTIESIVHPMSSLRKHVLGYFPKLRKFRGRNRVSAKKALEDAYLEWTFGWKPLAADVANAIAGISARHSTFDRVPITASATETFTGSLREVPVQPMSTNFTQYFSEQIYSAYTVRIKGAMKTGAVNGSIGVGQVLRLDLPNFIPTAWELLPYSFVADYFLNVGDFLQALTFRFSDLAYVCKTVRTITVVDYNQTRLVPPASFTNIVAGPARFRGGNSKFATVSFSRTIPSAYDLIPKLQFNLPLSSKPWINMGFLLSQASSRLVPFF